MANPFVNKKKVRGWKRQIRKLNKWKEIYININIKSIEKYKYDYVKIWIDPWDRLIKRNPPMWFQKLIIKGLVEIYENWKKQLEKTYKNYYLKLWVFEPNFYNSQVVVGIENKIGYYNNLFDVNSKSKVFPISYQNKDCDLTSFGWVCCIEKIYHFERDLDLGFISKLKPNGYEIIISDSGDKLYSFNLGFVWVGSKD